LTDDQENQPWVDNPFAQYDILEDGQLFLSWVDGNYRITASDGHAAEIDVVGTRSVKLVGPWQLVFPSGWVADKNKNITLEKLIPWSELSDPESRAFSGTATYEYTMYVEDIYPDEHVILDLGKVLNIASVKINGKHVAEKWAAPFRFDITGCLVKGANDITVQVTNTWYNRLVYDASLPEEQRKTWTIDGPEAQSQLQQAGLVGPVIVHYGKLVDINVQ